MDEQEWLDSLDAAAMLDYLRDQDQLPDRKLWLFRVVCCERIVHLAVCENTREAIGLAVAIAEGEKKGSALASLIHNIGRDDHDAAQAAARQACGELLNPQSDLYALRAGLRNAVLAVGYDVAYRGGLDSSWKGPRERAMTDTRLLHTFFVRDIFGNPFQKMEPRREWLEFRHGLIRAMADVIYREHSFEEMPILADALEDAGCDNADILDHLRGPGPHVRGCWVLDLLMGKA